MNVIDLQQRPSHGMSGVSFADCRAQAGLDARSSINTPLQVDCVANIHMEMSARFSVDSGSSTRRRPTCQTQPLGSRLRVVAGFAQLNNASLSAFRT